MHLTVRQAYTLFIPAGDEPSAAPLLQGIDLILCVRPKEIGQKRVILFVCTDNTGLL